MPSSLLHHNDRKKLRITAVVVFVLSFLLPTFSGFALSGYECLSYGILSFLTGHIALSLAWTANLIFVISLAIPAGLRKLRLLLATLMLFFASLIFFSPEIPVNDRGGVEPVAAGIGAVVWFIGVALLFLYHFLRRKSARR